MSVVKSKRSKSVTEFEMVYFKLADGIDTLVEYDFHASREVAQRNRKFIDTRGYTLERLMDGLLYHIKIANSIYPMCMSEWEERRTSISKSVGICYAILTILQRIMMRLRIPDNKYTTDINNVDKMINSLKAWRRSDNKLKEKIESK